MVIAISYEADEITNNVAAINASMNNLEKEKNRFQLFSFIDQIINGEIQFHENNEEPVQFGQATPWARQNSVFKGRKKKILCSSAVIILLLVTIFYIYSSSLTEKKTQSKPIVQEDEDTCECSTDIFEKKFGVYNDEQIFSLLINHGMSLPFFFFRNYFQNFFC